jgi:hypothetical protein
MHIGFHRETGGDFPADENMIVTEPAAVDAAVVRLPAIAAGDGAFQIAEYRLADFIYIGDALSQVPRIAGGQLCLVAIEHLPDGLLCAATPVFYGLDQPRLQGFVVQHKALGGEYVGMLAVEYGSGFLCQMRTLAGHPLQGIAQALDLIVSGG